MIWLHILEIMKLRSTSTAQNNSRGWRSALQERRATKNWHQLHNSVFMLKWQLSPLRDCQVQLEYFKLRFLSSKFQRQDDFPPAWPFSSSLIVLLKVTSLKRECYIAHRAKSLIPVLEQNLLLVICIITIQSHNELNLCVFILLSG